MAGRSSDFANISRPLRRALAAAVFAAFIYSAQADSGQEKHYVTCANSTTLISLPLTKTSDSVNFKCPANYTLSPEVSAKQQFCKDAKCNVTADLDDAYKLQAANKNEGYSLTMVKQPAASTNLYFVCKETTGPDLVRRVLERTQSAANASTCTIQVPVHGSSVFPASAETVCEKDPLSISLSPEKSTVIFRCGKDAALSPTNLENAFSGSACTTEKTLKELGVSGSLVEGSSGEASADAQTAYSLTVSSFPTESPAQLCYKCTTKSQPSDGKTTASECRVVIDVAQVSSSAGSLTAESSILAALALCSAFTGRQLL
ncbi:SAG-related sequence SRS48K [Besnoitia besnoiti]|uniref:SAG-related sequence SRS48K n=1 Tax=Besnoitia besnoiti TaxID=94643 RepID=A0A2A9MLI9_BESBE|nr:SAG-related sequence SRS48K [Besnoitia besnoiti]PFH36896.1 SAG-related sequence SRS48K [Besnoitia besnoiti]